MIIMWARASLFRTLTLIFITCIFILTALSAPAPDNYIGDPRILEVKELRCAKPQLRSYNLFDLLSFYNYSLGDYAPIKSHIILNRCDGHSGCCPAISRVCQPVANKTYYQEVVIAFSTQRKFDDSIERKFSIEQHVLCKCKHVPNNTDRRLLEDARPLIRDFVNFTKH